MFRGQAKNGNSDLEFADYSIKEPFNSNNADYIARGITDQLRLASIVVCLYGPSTYTSGWVDWELRKAAELQKPIMGVSLYGAVKKRHAFQPHSQESRWLAGISRISFRPCGRLPAEAK